MDTRKRQHNSLRGVQRQKHGKPFVEISDERRRRNYVRLSCDGATAQGHLQEENARSSLSGRTQSNRGHFKVE